MNYLFVAFQEIKTGLGTGHVSRVNRVLNFLDDGFYENNSVKFLSNSKHPNTKKYNSIFCETIKQGKEIIIELIKRKEIDFIIFDTLDYFKDLYLICSNNNIISIGLDTSSNESKYLDLLVNPVIKNDYSYLNGTEYSIHYEEKKIDFYKECKSNKSIFVCFGGLDHKNHLKKIYPSLMALSSKYEINIILSNNNKDTNYKHDKNINFFYRPSDFYEILKKCDFAFISGGIMLQETTYLGIPSLIFPQYAHQEEVAVERKLQGSIIDVIKSYSCNQIVDLIERSVNDKYINDISLRSRSLDDGFELKRFASYIRIYDYMEWDSNFFKKNIYQLNFKKYNKNINSAVNNLCESNPVDLIYFLCSSKDEASINEAIKNNFKIVDKRITFELMPENLKAIKLKENIKIVHSSEKHEDQLEKIAKDAKWTSRYFNDKNFEINDLKIFYSRWVKKSVGGKLDDMVFHIELEGKVCGFISIKKNGINVGSIGLIAIDNDFQGHGLGPALISHCSEYMFKALNCSKVIVVTQEENAAACSAYDKIGFRISDKSIWMHKWL